MIKNISYLVLSGSDSKESACQCRRSRFDPWVWKIPWRRQWQPTPVFFYLENPMDRGAWKATVHGVKKSQTRLISLAYIEICTHHNYTAQYISNKKKYPCNQHLIKKYNIGSIPDPTNNNLQSLCSQSNHYPNFS